MRLFIRPEAASELEVAYGWYEEQRPGLGEELIEEFRALLLFVADNPVRFGVIHRDARRVLLRVRIGKGSQTFAMVGLARGRTAGEPDCESLAKRMKARILGDLISAPDRSRS